MSCNPLFSRDWSLTSSRLAQPFSDGLRWSSDRSQFHIRHAISQDLPALAHILTHCFHCTTPNPPWFYPLIQRAVQEDLRQRFRSTSPYYACWVALAAPLTFHSPTPDPVLIGIIEMDLRHEHQSFWKSPLPWPFQAAHNSRPYLYLSNLAIHPHYRRQGVAQHLLKICEHTAGHWGFPALYLHVLENNDQARHLYDRSGYLLQHIDVGWDVFLFDRPRRLFLCKSILAKPVKGG